MDKRKTLHILKKYADFNKDDYSSHMLEDVKNKKLMRIVKDLWSKAARNWSWFTKKERNKDRQ